MHVKVRLDELAPVMVRLFRFGWNSKLLVACFATGPLITRPNSKVTPPYSPTSPTHSLRMTMRCGQDEFAAKQHASTLVLDIPIVVVQIFRFRDQHLPRPLSRGFVHDLPRVIQGLHTA